MTRISLTESRETTRTRWRRLSRELATLADAEDLDVAVERVGLLVVRESLALNVSTEIREGRD